MNTRKILYIPLLTVLLLTGCVKDFDKGVKFDTWTPDLAIPLVCDSITFEKGLETGGAEKNFIIDESGNISILFYYNSDAFKITPEKLISPISALFDFNHQFTPAEQQVIQNQDLVLSPQTIPIDVDGQNPGVRMDKMLIKKGMLTVTTSCDFNNSGNLTITIPEATKNGTVLTAAISPFSNGTTVQKIDISGFLFDMSAAPGQLSMVVTGTVKQGSSPIAGNSINSSFTLQFDTIGLFEGYFGNHLLELGEEYVAVNVFNNAFALGTLYFQEPSASVTAINSLGIPFKVTIESLRSVNLQSNVTYDITDQLGPNAIINVPSPLITATVPVTKTVEYTNANTNNSMNPFINIKPDRVYYKIKAEINPNNTGSNFFRDTSSFRADLRVKFPLYGYFDNLTVQDTFDFNLSEQNEITQLQFRTAITNGLPLMAWMQVYFTDERYTKLDSLTGTDHIFIREAPVDPSTHLPYPGEFGVKDTTFILDQARIEKLQTAKKILVKAVMNSSGGGTMPVKIKADQAIKLRFSALIKINHQIDQ